MIRYTNLNSRPEMKSSFSVQRSVRKVEKGFSAEVICGHVFHTVAKKAAIPVKHSTRLRT